MPMCAICNKKCSVWTAYFIDQKYYHEDCWKDMQSKLKEEKDKKQFEIEMQVKEFKRKCNRCGKVWHSLVEREKQIRTNSIFSGIVGVTTALTGNINASTQTHRNMDAQTQWLDSLKKCPNCGSTDYKEEIITFKKK